MPTMNDMPQRRSDSTPVAIAEMDTETMVTAFTPCLRCLHSAARQHCCELQRFADEWRPYQDAAIHLALSESFRHRMGFFSQELPPKHCPFTLELMLSFQGAEQQLARCGESEWGCYGTFCAGHHECEACGDKDSCARLRISFAAELSRQVGVGAEVELKWAYRQCSARS